MGKFIDITGLRYGELTVLGLADIKIKNRPAWRCLCDCGQTKIVAGESLKCGDVKCCGQHKTKHYSESLSARSKIHNRKYPVGTDSHSRLYTLWRAMKWRCNDPSHEAYARYGGAGIAICPEWTEFSNFREWAVANGYNEALTIDRIDNARGYSPSNCRWASVKEQAKNRKSTIRITAFNETKCLADWAEDPRCHVDARKLYKRITSGQPAEFAMQANEYQARQRAAILRAQQRKLRSAL